MSVKNINSVLTNMRKCGKLMDARGKGDAGEMAVLQIVLSCHRQTGGLVYHSYKYPYQSNRSGVVYTGNIKYEKGVYVEYTDSVLNDEIDVLYITPYRIFPIEVKSYHAKLKVYNDWMDYNGKPVEKSVVTQSEKHARHLYHVLSDVLPDGRPEYIKPIACFVDRCTVEDTRRDSSISYIPCCILNNFKKILIENNTPLAYNIDLEAIEQKLDSVSVSIMKKFV